MPAFTQILATAVAATITSVGARSALELVSGSVSGQLSMLSPYLDDIKLGLVVAAAPMVRSLLPL